VVKLGRIILEWGRSAAAMKHEGLNREHLRLHRSVRRVFFATVAGTLIWIAAIFMAPYLRSRSFGRAAAFLYALFAPLCHQIPTRCFYFHGFPLAVCSRCLGIYMGFLAGLALYPLARGFSRIKLPPARIFLAFSAPMALDALAGLAKVWETPLAVHFLTGLLWGAILPFYFLTGVVEWLVWRRRKGGGGSDPTTAGPGLDYSP